MNEKELPRSTSRIFFHASTIVAALGGAVVSSYFILPSVFSVSYESAATPTILAEASTEDAKPVAAHIRRPEPLKAIYMSQCVVGTPSFRDSLVEFVDSSELNAIVIDIRDYTGKISFQTDNPVLTDFVSDACGARDMKEFLARLHEKDIFVIGRITVFQNPAYTRVYPEQAVQSSNGGVWKDNKGLAFVDVSAKPYWDSVVELGKESYAIGFDELNFDYIRYPSDGPMSETVYSWMKASSKPAALEEFYKYLSDALRPTDSTGSPQAGPVLSADLFGMVTTNYDDLNIGQVLERALPYFDYIYPMVYPSHYPKGFRGYSNVNEHAYDIVKFAMDAARVREVATTTKIVSNVFKPIASTSPQLYEKPNYRGKVVPWLQSFDYPVHYTPSMVKEQIQATNDAGIDSWIFWDAANKYTSLRQVLAQ